MPIDPKEQERILEALQELLVRDGDVMTHYAVCYEAQSADGAVYMGYWHGPSGIPPWRSRGLHHQTLSYMDAEITHAELHSCTDEEETEDE